MTQIRIRSEKPADLPDIAAFEAVPESDGSEVAIVEKLRSTRALSLSLVATDADE